MFPSATNIGINLKFPKDCNDPNWRVSQKSGKNTLTTVSNRVQKPKPSLKISLPIIHYLKAMQQYKNTNAGMKTPSSNHTEVPRLPQQTSLQPTKPLPLSHSSLRMFRHPVPTGRGRIMLADKLESMIRTPKPISIKKTSKDDPNMSDSNINTPLIKEPVINKPEELKLSENKPNTTVEMLNRSTVDNSFTTSIKHKLPITVVARKRYCKRSSNPVNKENRLSTSTPTTVAQATQTENVFIVTEEGYQIIETVKTSGLTAPALQILIDNMEKQRGKNNDNDCEVIDLESTDVDSTKKDIWDIVMKHSSNNKNMLKSAAQILEFLFIESRQPSFARNMYNSDQQSLLEGPVSPTTFEPSPSGRTVPYTEMVNSFMNLVYLQHHGFRLTNNAVKPPSTYVQRTDLQSIHTSTQTEDENNNSKKRKRHAMDEDSSELVNLVEQNNFQCPPVVAMRSSQELSAFPPQMQRQFPQTQIQQFVHSSQFPSNLPSMMSQQRNQFTMPRNRPQYPFDHNRTSGLRTSQVQVQMPSPVQPPFPVQLPSIVQMHPNDPRNQGMQRQLGGQRGVSRVYSTEEANLRTQAGLPQHRNGNWSFPQYYNRYSNIFSQRYK